MTRHAKLGQQLIVLTTGIIFHASVMAESLSKEQYERQISRADVNFQSAKNACVALKDNAQDICMAKVKGRNDIVKALLKAQFEPTLEHQVEARIVMAEADFEIAMQKCDESSVKNKAFCINKAQIIKDQSIADARAMSKTTRLFSNNSKLFMSFNRHTNQLIGQQIDQYIYAKPIYYKSAKRFFV